MNKLVSIINGQAVTSSELIAAGTESEHASVIKLVRTYQTDLEEFGQVRFEIRAGYNNAQVSTALLNEQQTTLLLTYMRNSEIVRKFKKSLVKAFFEMAELARDPTRALNDPAMLRGLLGGYVEKVLVLEEKVAEIQPKADALDRLTYADGAMNLTNSAKHLQMRPSEFIRLLSAKKYIYKRAGGKSWIGYQDKIQSGLITHKVITVLRDDGTERICEQVLITPKGLTTLSKNLCFH